MSRFTGSLRFRWFDEMDNDGSKLDSAMFTDLRLSWNPSFADDSMTFTLGFNNVLDEDPPVCQNCGVIGFNPVVHDIPGRVGYVRFSYQPQ
jgi:iron complex outermembrane receptor protein